MNRPVFGFSMPRSTGERRVSASHRWLVTCCFVSIVCVGASACGDTAAVIADASVADASVADAMRALDAAPDAAPAADLSCVGDPAPTTAPDPTILSGSATAVDASGATPVESVALQVHLESDPMGNQLTSGVTDAAGLATLTVDTGGVPVDVFVRATPRDTYLVSETFFPDVVSANLPAPALLLTSGTLNLLGLAAGQTQQEENGFGALLVLDCAGSPIFNATVNSPTGTVVYAGDNGIPDPALSATGARGLAFVFNIVPGEGLTFNAEVDGTSLRSNSARAVATQIVSLAFAP